MRFVKNAERSKRGCAYCTDTERVFHQKKNGKKKFRMACIHNKCPYHELDNVNTYGEYIRSYGTDSVSALLKALLLSEQSEVCD